MRVVPGIAMDQVYLRAGERECSVLGLEEGGMCVCLALF